MQRGVSVAGIAGANPMKLRRRLAMSDRIRRALGRDDGFLLYEQPIRSLSNDRIARSSEILVRMPGEDGDVLPPAVFLYVADRFGLMTALDEWVISHVLTLLAERQAAGVDMGIEVNLSGTSIGDPTVVDFIASKRFGSFHYLKHLPFDVVKIDGAFIKGLTMSRTDRLTVEAIVTITQGLEKRTVAEFVADAATVELLRSYGVDFAQGYHVGKPEPVALRPRFATAAGA